MCSWSAGAPTGALRRRRSESARPCRETTRAARRLWLKSRSGAPRQISRCSATVVSVKFRATGQRVDPGAQVERGPADVVLLCP